MPSASIDKLNQLKKQLQECTNPTAAKLLKSTIAKLESQLNLSQDLNEVAKDDQPKATNTKNQTAQRKAALMESQNAANRKASQNNKTILKPPSIKKVEPQPEVVSQNLEVPISSQEKPRVSARKLRL